jgi:hypothetical protein
LVLQTQTLVCNQQNAQPKVSIYIVYKNRLMPMDEEGYINTSNQYSIIMVSLKGFDELDLID